MWDSGEPILIIAHLGLQGERPVGRLSSAGMLDPSSWRPTLRGQLSTVAGSLRLRLGLRVAAKSVDDALTWHFGG